jgi:hypothetical protein
MNKFSDSIREEYIESLRLVELQLQLTISVRLACSLHNQPLMVPDLWIYGQNQLEGCEIQLTPDSADIAATLLEHTVTHVLCIHALEAIKRAIDNVWDHLDKNIVAAHQICRLIRNAYAHNPHMPVWRIDKKSRNKIYEIMGVIQLNTEKLEGQKIKWQHYGGIIALWNLSHWVRVNILKDANKIVILKDTYTPSGITQQGRLIVKWLDKTSSEANDIPLDKIVEIAGKRYLVIGSDSDGTYKIEL